MKYCDLHNHSVYSDGSYTPSELLAYAKEKGLCAIALTDHNTVAGMEDFEASLSKTDIEGVFGTELTTEYQGKETHLLALFVTKDNASAVNEFTEERLRIKNASNADLAKRLNEGGYKIDFTSMQGKYKNINRSHFAKEMVEAGYFKTTEEAFVDVLRQGGKFYKPFPRADLVEAVKLVKKWGCVSVLAHPLLNLTPSELEGALPSLKEAGLCGIEAHYPKFTPEQREYLCALADKYALVASGGSDFHGDLKEDRVLGSANVPYSSFCELVKIFENIQRLKG